ncbi:unnamed protein product [Triticum turgidum subsp. durum]|uniref:PB1 domain-containing protein n=1 Tax=Triticum turgidum subsp. durum TaxID=4567 RepID=A0A9R1QZ45_TRITD|nr:unnamed protein product [Triticum turgidum subsp. durum]
MTASPGCATLDTSILEVLQSMQDRKYHHILRLFGHSTVNPHSHLHGRGSLWTKRCGKYHGSEVLGFSTCLACSDESRTAASDSAEGKQTPPHVGNAFSFKIEDRKGRMHRFSCVSESLDELVSAIAYRLGTENKKANVNLLYDDDEGDRVLLATDGDLVAAIEHARSAGWKVLRLHMDDGPETGAESTPTSSLDTLITRRGCSSLRLGRVAGAAAFAGVRVIVYLKCSRQ